MTDSVDKNAGENPIDGIYRILCEKSNDSITLFKINEFNEIGNFVYANSATSKWTGYTKEEILQASPTDLLPADQLEVATNSIETIVNEGFLTYESEIKLKDGSVLPIEFSASLVEYEGEKYILTSGREIAERVHSRKEREENMKEKTLLLDILTHDLRNYIAVLWGCVTDTLDAEEVDMAAFKESIGRAKTSLAKTDALLDDISVLMKKDLEFTYELKSVNVLNTIQKCKPNLDDMFPTKKITLNTEKTDPELNVQADMLFEQLLFNIFTNSAKNSKKKEVIVDVETELKRDNTVVVTVSDYSKGIAPEIRRNIFDRYSEFRKKGKGSGLGLFIIQTLVQRYNGEVWIENRVKGDYSQGTSVKVKLRKSEGQTFEFA